MISNRKKTVKMCSKTLRAVWEVGPRCPVTSKCDSTPMVAQLIMMTTLHTTSNHVDTSKVATRPSCRPYKKRSIVKTFCEVPNFSLDSPSEPNVNALVSKELNDSFEFNLSSLVVGSKGIIVMWRSTLGRLIFGVILACGGVGPCGYSSLQLQSSAASTSSSGALLSTGGSPAKSCCCCRRSWAAENTALRAKCSCLMSQSTCSCKFAMLRSRVLSHLSKARRASSINWSRKAWSILPPPSHALQSRTSTRARKRDNRRVWISRA
mmetsp:Transcript_80962/g.261543  ORF Transcript_80962/g.261543 Transcript_80962/m.261543 type:complete len:265 (-) Transcript_80962:55-849(-)